MNNKTSIRQTQAQTEIWKIIKELSISHKNTDRQIKLFVAEMRANQAEIARERKEWALKREQERKKWELKREQERKKWELKRVQERERERKEAKIKRAQERKEAKIKRVQERKEAKIKRAQERKEWALKRAQEHKEWELKREQEHKEWELKREQERKETARDFKRIFRKSEELFSGQWGKLVESLVEGDLLKKLKERGIRLGRTAQRVQGVMLQVDSKGNATEKRCEIDILVRNGPKLVAVEVKTSLSKKDIDDFLGVLQNFTKYFPDYSKKKVYGGVAYLRVQKGVEIYAERKGLFVIRATGNSSSIINKRSFKPKDFS